MKRVIIIFTLSVISLLFLQPFFAKGDESAYTQGTKAANEGKLDLAITKLSEAIQMGSKIAYSVRGQVWCFKQEYAKAIADQTEVIALFPEDESAYMSRACTYYEMREYDKAIADYSHAIQLNPHDRSAYTSRAFAYRDEGKYDKALADYSLIEPLLDYEYESRSQIQKLAGNYGAALDDAIHSLDAPTQGSVLQMPGFKQMYVAEILATAPQAGVRDGKKAVEYATKACELSNWDDSMLFITLGEAYAEAGDFDQAVKWENKWLETPNLNEIATAVGRARLALYQAHKPYHSQK